MPRPVPVRSKTFVRVPTYPLRSSPYLPQHWSRRRRDSSSPKDYHSCNRRFDFEAPIRPSTRSCPPEIAPFKPRKLPKLSKSLPLGHAVRKSSCPPGFDRRLLRPPHRPRPVLPFSPSSFLHFVSLWRTETRKPDCSLGHERFHIGSSISRVGMTLVRSLFSQSLKTAVFSCSFSLSFLL